MTELKDYQLTKRFKATLANFHSYCQKQAQQYPEVKEARANSNKSITKYRSIREIRKLSAGKKETSQARRKEDQGNQPVLNLRSTDLIEIIRMKLNSSQPMQLKTEGNQARNQLHLKRYNNLQFTHFNNKSMELSNPTRRKKFNFVVNNTKIKLSENPKTKRQKKYEECVVTLHNRPQSAIQQPLKYISVDETAPVKHKYSQSDLVKQKFSQKSLNQKKNTKEQSSSAEKERCKELSGWEMGNFDDQLITIQDLRKHSQKRKKNKFQ